MPMVICNITEYIENLYFCHAVRVHWFDKEKNTWISHDNIKVFASSLCISEGILIWQREKHLNKPWITKKIVLLLYACLYWSIFSHRKFICSFFYCAIKFFPFSFSTNKKIKWERWKEQILEKQELRLANQMLSGNANANFMMNSVLCPVTVIKVCTIHLRLILRILGIYIFS